MKQAVQRLQPTRFIQIASLCALAFILCMLCLTIATTATASEPIASDPTETLKVEGRFYYGNYAYTIENGRATIVGVRSYDGGSGWDDPESERYDRPGKDDASAAYDNHVTDGVWQTLVPSALGGYPVVAIGTTGFTGCFARDIILPEGLTSIRKGAFYGCKNTFAITVPQSVAYIGESAFNADCSATLRVTEGSYAAQYAQENGLPYTYDQDFRVYKRDRWYYTLQEDAATIVGYDGNADYEAYSAQFNDDKASDDSDYIVQYHAAHAINLQIPDRLDGHSVTAIKVVLAPFEFGKETDDLCWNVYSSIAIPDSMTTIDDNSLGGPVFERFIVSANNPVYESVDGVLFDKREKVLLAYPGGRAGSYAIPEGTRSIGKAAFKGCFRLTGVTIPGSVTRIGVSAFDGCVSLAFANISDGVTHIDDYAFYFCTALVSATLPNSVVDIGAQAFCGCRSLTSLTIPPSVTYIDESAFFGDDVLELDVTAGSYAEQYAKDNDLRFTFSTTTKP